MNCSVSLLLRWKRESVSDKKKKKQTEDRHRQTLFFLLYALSNAMLENKKHTHISESKII